VLAPLVPAGSHYPHADGLHKKLMTETYAGSLRRPGQGFYGSVRGCGPARLVKTLDPALPAGLCLRLHRRYLIDLADREQLPPAELLILDTYGQEILNLSNENQPSVPTAPLTMLAQRSWVHTARRILGGCPSRVTGVDRVHTDRVDATASSPSTSTVTKGWS
jgi:hypothetical protein